MGFSLEMGAFLIGFLLASSPFRHQLSGQVAPLRDLFMAVFFTTLGMELDLEVVLSNAEIIILGTFLLLIIKALGIFLAGWLLGVRAELAALSAVILSQAGEFSLIIFGEAADYGVLGNVESSIVIGIVVFSLIVTPSLFVFSKRVSKIAKIIPHPPWVHGGRTGMSEEGLFSCTGEHIVVAGYGPIGREVCAVLDQSSIPFTVVELNHDTVKEQSAAGVRIVYGDISNEALLQSVRIEEARALILTFPEISVAVQAAELARTLNPQIEIVGRASSKNEQFALEATAIDDAVIDEEQSAKAMVELAHQISEVR